MTSTAVSVGMPPIASAIPIAIGVVTDFGASDATVCGDAPSAQASPIAVTIAVTEPAPRPPLSERSAA